MIFNELPISFPWYDDVELQNREKENAQVICDFKLVTPYNALLPFQFTRSIYTQFPTRWGIYNANSQDEVVNLDSIVATDLRVHNINGLQYYTYDGHELTQGGLPIRIPQGWYYSTISWGDGLSRHSELFYVPATDAGAFRVQDDDDINFIKLEWYNLNDLDPIFYNDLVDDLPRFRNVVYLDTFIVNSEPEIVVDGTKDGNDTQINTFQKATINYRITQVCPDYLKNALMIMQIHDYVFLTTQQGLRSGEMKAPVVTFVLDGSGGISIVDIVWTERTILKRGCGENMPAVLADL